jgi:hypothetical protein
VARALPAARGVLKKKPRTRTRDEDEDEKTRKQTRTRDEDEDEKTRKQTRTRDEDEKSRKRTRKSKTPPPSSEGWAPSVPGSEVAESAGGEVLFVSLWRA